MTCIIAVANQKGGVGKTTTSVNVAASFASRGFRVLLVDLDPQGNASTHVGIAADGRAFGSYQLFAGTQLHHALRPEPTIIENLSVLGASMDLAGIDTELADAPDRAFRLRDAITGGSAKGCYEVIIIDCPPSFGMLTVNSLAAANQVLIPLQCEFLALEGLAHLKRTIDSVRRSYNPDLSILGILLTMFDRRNSLSDLVAADVRSFFGALVLNTFIPRNVRLTEAPSHGLPINRYDARSPGAIAYEKLAEELLVRIGLKHVVHA